MHLIPSDRAVGSVIDDHRVCEAFSAVADVDAVSEWSQRFSLVGDPTRLALLLGIYAAGPISVSDLALACDLNPTTVSQALRMLRTAGVVTAERDGRIIRYRLSDSSIAGLLDEVKATPGDKSGTGGSSAQKLRAVVPS